MRLFLTISLWLFFTSMLYAEPIRGASYIGMCSPHFPCERALSLQPEAIGYLADAFGRKCQCVQKALKIPSLRYLRVHISNGTCFPERGRRCESSDVFYRETQGSAQKKILSGDRVIYRRFLTSLNASIRLLEGHGKEVRYSPMLESPFPTNVRRRLLRAVERQVGKERTVDSVLSQKCLEGYICERHGDAPQYAKGQRCISDLDGITLFEANLQSLKSRSEQCEAIFYWSTGFNLLPIGYDGPFIPPMERRHRFPKWELEGLRQCLEPL
jgi:hypothetical protein